MCSRWYAFTALALLLMVVVACSSGESTPSESRFSLEQLPGLIPPASQVEASYEVIELEQFRGSRSDDQVDALGVAAAIRDGRLGGYLVLYGAAPGDAGLEVVGYEVHVYETAEAASVALAPLNELYSGPLGECSVSEVRRSQPAIAAEAIAHEALRTCSNGDLWTSSVLYRIGNLVGVLYASHATREGLDAIGELSEGFAEHVQTSG